MWNTCASQQGSVDEALIYSEKALDELRSLTYMWSHSVQSGNMATYLCTAAFAPVPADAGTDFWHEAILQDTPCSA